MGKIIINIKIYIKFSFICHSAALSIIAGIVSRGFTVFYIVLPEAQITTS